MRSVAPNPPSEKWLEIFLIYNFLVEYNVWPSSVTSHSTFLNTRNDGDKFTGAMSHGLRHWVRHPVPHRVQDGVRNRLRGEVFHQVRWQVRDPVWAAVFHILRSGNTHHTSCNAVTCALQECETKYEQECSTSYEEVCEEAIPQYNTGYGAPSYSAPKCKQVRESYGSGSTFINQSVLQVPKQTCNNVPKQSCKNVPKQVRRHHKN